MYDISIACQTIESTNCTYLLQTLDMSLGVALKIQLPYNFNRQRFAQKCQVQISLRNAVTVASCHGVALEFFTRMQFPLAC